jgi:transposase
MTRLHGWAPRGRRLVAKVPHGHWKTATFLAALRSDRIDAPCLFDGPINGERFRAYVEQFLVPTLKPNDIVVLDNLGSHKGKAVRRAVRDVGARLLFLPKYSPDLNPIEQLFAKLKGFVRIAEPRTRRGLQRNRRGPRHRRAPRMRQLPRQRRICVKLNAERSSEQRPNRGPESRRDDGAATKRGRTWDNAISRLTCRAQIAFTLPDIPKWPLEPASQLHAFYDSARNGTSGTFVIFVARLSM